MVSKIGIDTGVGGKHDKIFVLEYLEERVRKKKQGWEILLVDDNHTKSSFENFKSKNRYHCMSV